MIIEQTTTIAAAPERVYAFFEHMERNYLRWHKDHIAFRWLQPGRLAEGNRFCLEEEVHGQHVKRSVRFTRILPNRLIEFAPENPLARLFLPRIAFEIEPLDQGCRFTQRLHVRIGPIGRWLNRKGFAAVEQHMREEGNNLKRMLEAA
jgi:uncharacterized protein YndB with AHSA1/START domain